MLANPSYAPAWFWMSRLVDEPRRKRECLERALALDPQLAPARIALEQLDSAEAPERLPYAEAHKLGAYLIERGLISPAQLELALLEQRSSQRWGKRVPLGEILIRRGLISPQMLADTLMLQQRDRLRVQQRPERLGEYLISGKYVSAEQLCAALAEQALLRQHGQHVVLGVLLLRCGVLSAEALERVLQRQRQDYFSGNAQLH